MTSRKDRYYFPLAALIISIPCLCLSAPLWFHISPQPIFATYSQPYLIGLTVWHLFWVALLLHVARRCQITQRLHQAVATALIIAAMSGLAWLTEGLIRTQNSNSFALYEQWGHKKSAVFGYEARPNHRWEFAEATYTTDPLGFRTHLQDPWWMHRESDKIFVLGGSSAFGYGLNDNETWPHRLEYLHNAKYPDHPLVIINAANNGHSSFQTFLRFYIKVIEHKPAAVILYQNYNDISRSPRSIHAIAIPEDLLFSKTTADHWAQRQKQFNVYARTLLYKTWLDMKKTVGARFSAKTDTTVFMEEEKYWNIQRRNGRLFIQNIDTLAILCRRHNIKLIIATFLQDDQNMPRTKSASIKFHNQLLRDYAQQENISLIDLEEKFATIEDKAAYFFEDHYHPNKKGAEFIARQLTQYLASEKLAR